MIRQLKNLVTNKIPVISRKIYHNINKAIYKGDKYYCPICENGYRRFLPGPDKIRSNSKCPGCSSLERHRLLWLLLKSEKNIQSSEIRLFNIAPDYATQNKLKKLINIDYTSVDLDSPLANHKADLTNLKFHSDTFDAILCYHVLEHIEDDSKAMTELFRVLKPGGWAILQTPVDWDIEETLEDISVTSPEERKRIYGQADHVRIYGRDYSLRLEKAGFVVKEDMFIKRFGEIELDKYVLDKDEVIFLCSKPGN